MTKTNERVRDAGLALLACGLVLGASVLLSQRSQDGPVPTAASRDEARICLVEDDLLPPLI